MFTRPVAAILLATLIPQLCGCAVHTTQRVRPGEVRFAHLGGAMARPWFISGVRTRDGTEVPFDTLSARVANDSIYASVQGRPYVISLRQVVRIVVVRDGANVVTDPSALPTVIPRARAPESVRGVTTVDGRNVAFDRTLRPWVANDTLYATTRQGTPFKVPFRDIQRYWVSRANLGLSALATIGGTTLLLGGLLAVACLEGCSPM